MAPSPLNPGENAQSALLTSSAIITPSIIIVASAAGVAALLFLAILAVFVYRRIHWQQLEKPRAEDVPRLVITDTSMFPASDVVVQGDSDLDKVIASFKPLGADMYALEEKMAVKEVSETFVHDADEGEQFAPLQCSRSKHGILPKARRASVSFEDHKNIKGVHFASQIQDCSSGDITDYDDSVEILEGVWWYDFQAEDPFDSISSLSEADTSDSSMSIYSTSTCEVSAPLKFSERRSSATVSALNEALKASYAGEDQSRKANELEGTNDAGSENQDTPYDKDILAYCWRLSEDGRVKTRERRASIIDDQPTGKSKMTKFTPSRSKATSLRTVVSSANVDQKILEYCWGLSEHSSLKSIGALSDSESAKVRFKKAMRCVSDASLSGFLSGNTAYDMPVPPLPSSAPLFDKYENT